MNTKQIISLALGIPGISEKLHLMSVEELKELAKKLDEILEKNEELLQPKEDIDLHTELDELEFADDIQTFAELADVLDKKGLFKSANKIDNFVKQQYKKKSQIERIIVSQIRQEKQILSVFKQLEKTAAEYQGKKVKLNDPIRNPSGSKKKFKVYVKDPKSGKVKKIQFGDPKMEIKRDDPKRRKSFRARHKCDQAKDKTKARYWSCWQWRQNKKVDN